MKSRMLTRNSMVPDKIYLGIGPMSGDEPNKRYLYAEWYEEQKPLVQNIAYIRKDALLEWAKEKQRRMKIEAGGCYNTLAAGKFIAYKEIFDKIESL